MGGSADGDAVDGIVITDDIYPEEDFPPPLTAAQERRSLKPGAASMMDRGAKSGIPDINEWLHFFSAVLIKSATEFYIDYAFRGVDESALSDREYSRITLLDEERDRIARPFAEMAQKNRYMRKHGRSIVAAGDSIDAVLQLGMWYRRVSQISAKYRAPAGHQPRPQRQSQRASQKGDSNVGTEQITTPSANGYHRPGFPAGIPVYPDMS